MLYGELIISNENDPLIALGMTGASFDSAQRAGIDNVEADLDAMTYIAGRVGYTGPTENLSPLVIVTRESSDERKLIGHWDDRLPFHQGNPDTGRFFPARRLDESTPPSANREFFAEVARRIGAPALTEISIPSWKDETSHAGDFATGLLLGQRPVDLPPKPRIINALGDFFAVRSTSRTLATLKAVRADRTMPAPFIISRQSDRLRIGG